MTRRLDITADSSPGRTGPIQPVLGNSIARCTTVREPRRPADRQLARPAERRRVVEALRRFIPGTDGREWLVHRLAAGKQAVLFTVRAPGGRPVWEAHPVLVVKLYRSDRLCDRVAVEDELESLYRLHERLDGTTVCGWQVRCPLPLHRNDFPLALVMTAVPGASINSSLASRLRPASEVLDSIADAAIECLERYWAGEPRPYGDPNLKNILYDLPTRTLSFVDPGLPEQIYRCDAAPNRWYPASRDLGFLLYWTAVTVKSSFGRPRFQQRRERMVMRMLRAAVGKLGLASQRADFLDEIEACTRVHLQRIPVSCSPAGIWRRFVRASAAQTIGAILREQRAAVSCAGTFIGLAGALAVDGTAVPGGKVGSGSQGVPG